MVFVYGGHIVSQLSNEFVFPVELHENEMNKNESSERAEIFKINIDSK